LVIVALPVRVVVCNNNLRRGLRWPLRYQAAPVTSYTTRWDTIDFIAASVPGVPTLADAAARTAGVGGMSATAKVTAAATRALPHLAPETRDAVARLITPQNMELLAGGAAVWGAAHLVGVGEAADAVAAVGAAVGLGSESLNVASDVAAFARGALTARSDADLDAAGQHLARAIGAVGVDGVSALLLHRGGKIGPDLDAVGDAAVARTGPALATETGAGTRMPVPPAEETGHVLEARRAAPPPPRMTLGKHEAAGGHVIAKHVGVSVADLRARLRSEPKLKVASSFFRRSDADRALKSTFKDPTAAKKIATWKASGEFNRLTLDHDAGFTIGRTLARGSTCAEPSSTVRAFLVRDDSRLGYHVLTAFPMKEK